VEKHLNPDRAPGIDYEFVVAKTDGFSGSDVVILCKEGPLPLPLSQHHPSCCAAAMPPLRRILFSVVTFPSPTSTSAAFLFLIREVCLLSAAMRPLRRIMKQLEAGDVSGDRVKLGQCHPISGMQTCRLPSVHTDGTLWFSFCVQRQRSVMLISYTAQIYVLFFGASDG